MDTISISLTQGQVAILDAEDWPLIEPYTWWAQKTSVGFYATTKFPKTADGYRRGMQMHRLIMGDPPDHVVDHINHDTLDNRRCNLRLATASQNRMNTRAIGTSRSGYKGVYWKASHNRWESQLRLNGKTAYLGHFEDAEVAARAYDAKARELYGVFAHCNFPTP